MTVGTAVEAKSATFDSDGNKIVDTYATKDLANESVVLATQSLLPVKELTNEVNGVLYGRDRTAITEYLGTNMYQDFFLKYFDIELLGMDKREQGTVWFEIGVSNHTSMNLIIDLGVHTKVEILEGEFAGLSKDRYGNKAAMVPPHTTAATISVPIKYLSDERYTGDNDSFNVNAFLFIPAT